MIKFIFCIFSIYILSNKMQTKKQFSKKARKLTKNKLGKQDIIKGGGYQENHIEYKNEINELYNNFKNKNPKVKTGLLLFRRMESDIDYLKRLLQIFNTNIEDSWDTFILNFNSTNTRKSIIIRKKQFIITEVHKKINEELNLLKSKEKNKTSQSRKNNNSQMNGTLRHYRG